MINCVISCSHHFKDIFSVIPYPYDIETTSLVEMVVLKKGSTGLFRLLFFFFFFSFFSFTLGDSAGKEIDLLLSFKASVRDPFRLFANWDPSVSFCHWHGVACLDNSSVSHVIGIELSGKNISGNISASIFQLPFVETINLSNNQLSDKIPIDMASCSSLRSLNLSNNNLTGQLPIRSNSLSHLEALDLSNNMLSGEIPTEIGMLSGLKVLDLGGNSLVGGIPKSISNITGLQFLTLSSNQLVGEIPRELGQMKSLKWIYLGYNNLSGEIPKEIGELTSLNHLDLVYNNLTGEIPPSLGNLSDLRYLFLYQNKHTGSIPPSIFGLRNLVSLDLSDNSLSGDIPELVIHLEKLEILHLFSNNLTGKIPNSLSSLPRLEVLQLWSNRLHGEIPKNLGEQNNLSIVDLSTNNLSGEIPQTLCNSGRLFKLILFSNFLQGEIPKSLGRCKSLRRVRIQNNCLFGKLPPEFTNLPLVYFLDLSANNLSGTISDWKWHMPALQMLNLARNGFVGNLPDSFGTNKLENLDLSENQFSGTIPSRFGNLSELMQLQLSRNKLSGEIPDQLSSCTKLVSLDLSHNQLNGEIPPSLSELPVLGKLDLSENQLSGKIPQNLGKVESLVQVNISHNHFHGSLPSTGAFLAINASAVSGNELCDGNERRGLSPCKTAKNPIWWFLVTCLLVVLGLLALIALAIVLSQRCKETELRKRVENEDGIWEAQFFNSKVWKAVTIDDIATSVREENVVARGRRGASYKGKSAIADVQFFVKEMTEFNSNILSSTWTEMTEFGKLRHPNIVKLMGICRSKKLGYLIFEFVAGKNLGEVLKDLSWDRRRKIATGIAKALRFLHSYCSPSVLVGDMSPEKVMVDGCGEARLRLNLPVMVCMDSKSFSSSPYVAPECRETKASTEKSDIYGFGLILIGLLAGRSPADAEFGIHDSIVEWARYCYSDCHLDTWIDPTIRGHASSNVINQNEMVETMNLALHCTATDPTARPCAANVSKTLHSIMKSSRSSCVSGGLKFSPSFC
ncbi:leucine-rich repeat receptor-like serine/threonine-protein kinase SKM1 [Malania oleifera]|uniref:leucine-rich repeat receptor-like serine/threonine-protein kinase SKM1 n=1 Tax=Malania oleifera TaxID=397392 RepID=UPI0025AE8D86|nr:leucine-rich repeat receptor-like serine/threonine-protein kinase SKM1 [Malania oleifera]